MHDRPKVEGRVDDLLGEVPRPCAPSPAIGRELGVGGISPQGGISEGQVALAALQRAGLLLMFATIQNFKQTEPESYEQMRQALEGQELGTGVTMKLSPHLVVQCWLETPDGQRHVFATVQTNEIPGGPVH